MIEIKPTNVNGTDYFTVQEFATVCGKGSSQIYALVNNGIIKHEMILNQRMIPVCELDKREKLFGSKE